jgi:hypothetical protein
MAIRVPESQVVYIKKLLELPEEKIDKFLEVLGNAGPQFNVFDLADKTAGSLGLPQEFTVEILRVLTSLYLTRDWKTQPIEEFVDKEVFPALKRANAFSAEQIGPQWKKLRKLLVTGLSFERSVGTAAKAGVVLTNHERIFSGARIMTDMRPIFHLNVSEKPEAAMIIHMLKITQRDSHQRQNDLYFALDSNDIQALKDLIDRAMAKEKTLKDVLQNSGITVLDPKLIY